MHCQEIKLFVCVCSTYHIGEALGNMCVLHPLRLNLSRFQKCEGDSYQPEDYWKAC